MRGREGSEKVREGIEGKKQRKNGGVEKGGGDEGGSEGRGEEK